MQFIRKLSSTSNVFRVGLRNSTTGAGLTGLTSASTGLIIGTICDNEATATAYTAAGSTVETITTLGTFATPTATKCRFKEVDATNHPGLYEIQLADARFAVSSAKVLRVTIAGATSLLQKDVTIQLTAVDVDDAVRGGQTALPNTACTTNASLLTSGTGTDQLSVSAGKVGLTAAAVQAVWDALTSALTTVGSIGKKLADWVVGTIDTYTGNTKQTGDAYAVVTDATFGNSKLVRSSTPANALAVDASGRIDLGKIAGSTTAVTLDSNQALSVNAKYLNSTALTARDIGASVLISAGVGTGQLDVTAGVIKANATQWLGTAVSANTAGVPKVDVSRWNNVFVAGSVSGFPVVSVNNLETQAQTDALSALTGGTNTIAVDSSHRVKTLDSGGNAFTYTAPDNADAVIAATNTAALIQMTTGTGTARLFTVNALSNAPAGGGGGGGTNVNVVMVGGIPIANVPSSPAIVVITAPTNTNQVGGWLNTFDGHGATNSAGFEFSLVACSNTASTSFPRQAWTASSTNGVLVELFEQNSAYKGRRVETDGTDGPWVPFNTPTNGTQFGLPQILGGEVR